MFWYTAACAEPTAPAQQPPTIELATFETKVWYAVTPPEGVLSVYAQVAETEFRAREESRFPLEVRTSSGDMEQAFFKRALCGPIKDLDPWFCDGIIVDMDDGFSVEALHPRMRTLQARFTTPPSIGHFAGMRLFGISLDDAIRTVRGWPGVRRVEPSKVFPNLEPGRTRE